MEASVVPKGNALFSLDVQINPKAFFDYRIAIICSASFLKAMHVLGIGHPLFEILNRDFINVKMVYFKEPNEPRVEYLNSILNLAEN